MMQRRHFEVIAAALLAAEPDRSGRFEDPKRRAAAVRAWETCVEEMVNALRYTNPAFDATRFLKACGYEKES